LRITSATGKGAGRKQGGVGVKRREQGKEKRERKGHKKTDRQTALVTQCREPNKDLKCDVL